MAVDMDDYGSCFKNFSLTDLKIRIILVDIFPRKRGLIQQFTACLKLQTVLHASNA